ncbi:MAG: diaminopimelate decarboxylase [Prevotellaceae bacterium]|jgi:diaminopimelate decarboxylase|nr:diaminopimelate decarboxylase [Prevotellaceae bacterium]
MNVFTRFVPAFETLKTPFYFYDMELLRRTVTDCKNEMSRYGYQAHYALKANANEPVLKVMREAGFGADCVSGNEVLWAIKNGFPPEKIVYSSVGKTDEELKHAMAHRIFCINCESTQEIEVLNSLATAAGTTVDISVRLNPDIDPHTHEYITTGLEENKFGISPWEFGRLAEILKTATHLRLTALHVHVGSQIIDWPVFQRLCERFNDLQDLLCSYEIQANHLNLGGGLGVDYADPDGRPVVDFKRYFDIIHRHLKVRPGQTVHVEPGRSLVAQCGSVITRVLYVKNGQEKNFVVVDAGMTDLLRPALYQAQHAIQQLSSQAPPKRYDVVGPICESGDCFGKNISLPQTQRGDLIAIRTAGAYGQTMAMQYNLRDLPLAYYSDNLASIK